MSGILPSFRKAAEGIFSAYLEEGGDPKRLVLCHQDGSGDDPDYQIGLLRRGFHLEYDTFGRAVKSIRLHDIEIAIAPSTGNASLNASGFALYHSETRYNADGRVHQQVETVEQPQAGRDVGHQRARWYQCGVRREPQHERGQFL